MNFVHTPYWQIFATPWRVARPWSFSRWLIGILALAALGFLTMSIWFASIWFPSLPGLKKSTAVMGIFCVVALWLIWSAWCLKLNEPVVARVVPQQLRYLRQTMVFLWALCVAVTSATLEVVFGSGIGGALVVALGMAAPLLITRFIWLTPFGFVLWAGIVISGSILQLENEAVEAVQRVFAIRPYAISVAGLIGLAWLLGWVVLRSGGPAHTAAYAQGKRLSVSNKAMSFEDLLTDTNQPGLKRNRPTGLYLKYALRHAEPVPANVLRRVDAALTRPERAVVYCIPLACLAVVAASGLWFKSELTTTLTVGMLTWLALLLQHLTRSTRLLASTNAQAVMLLLPGMPRGGTLNTLLAGRHIAQSFGIWLVVMLICWLPNFEILGERPWPWDGVFLRLLVVGWLPMLCLALRNWSADSSSSAGRIVGILTLFLLGPACAVAHFVFHVPIVHAVVGVVLGTVFALTWQWMRLARLPQAFPVGHSM